MSLRFDHRVPLLLDGPTGTELERRGVDTSRRLWSARAIVESPAILANIHCDYIDAGADIVTVNTFRTNRRAVVGSGLDARDAGRLTREAAAIARRSVERCGRRDVLLAASDAPVEDCYAPALVPTDAELRDEHREHIEMLVEAGCDVVLIETMNTLREAVIAAEVAGEIGHPFIVSVVTDESGERMLSGEPLADVVRALASHAPFAILSNCASPRATARAVALLATLAGASEAAWKFGGYANGGEPDPIVGYRKVRTIPIDEFVASSRSMLEAGAHLTGSCCGTTPAHTRELFRLIEHRRATEPSIDVSCRESAGKEVRNDAE
jgi:S-methylmethionine-dependent homocysteine/selenocysteine methylase